MSSRYPGGVVRKTAANTSIIGASGVWDLGSQAQAVKTNTWPISGLANPVSGSLRFRRSASAYLNRTPASASNRRTFTWSGWVKLGSLGVTRQIFGAGSGATQSALVFEAGDTLFAFSANASETFLRTTQVFRDPSAWYHVVWAEDTTQATSSNRSKLYINGVQITAFSTANYPSPNFDGSINNNAIHYISTYDGSTWAHDGYMAEVNFVDGQQLTPSSFGQTSPITGVWEPIKYTGTYGTNGFYLSLSDTSSIGKDFSGNGNNWTPNNISTANDSTFDLMRDVPTQYTPQGVTDVGGVVRGNYATLNPLMFRLSNTPGATLSAGNLTSTHTPSAYGSYVFSSIAATGDKFYYEAVVTTLIGGVSIGIDGGLGVNSSEAARVVYQNSALKRVNGSSSAYGASYTTGDVIGVAIDLINGTITFYKNNVSQGVASSGIGTTPYFTYGESDTGNVINWNFGQRPFTYTPPSGFKSLCTTNLPTPTIGATVATAANKYFDATTYTGTGATLSVTNAGEFQPDFVWLKSRSATTNHQLFDAVRGTTKVIISNTTESESTSANTITSFNSGGFTVGTNTAINTSAATYVGWQWWAGGSTVTNTTGSISSQVRASTTAGFSVVTYIGNGTGGATIGHGLGAAPGMLMFKNRDETGGNSILVWHSSFTNQEQMLLSSTAAIYNPGNGLYFNSTTPGASVVTLGTSGSTNPSAVNMLMYAWAPIAGYSAFGSYTGNGSTDGPFVHTGFRPKFVMIKASSISGENWYIVDSSRSPYNAAILYLSPNNTGAEASPGAAQFFDFLSNGFKLRVSGSYSNSSGATYIYMAFAEHPFKNSLAR